MALERLVKSSDPRVAAAAKSLTEKLVWPGKDGKPLPEKSKLTLEQQQLVELGRREYASICAACHHNVGYGLAAKGPPLLGSSWLASDARAIRLVLHGLKGPIATGGEIYNSDSRLIMPGMSKLLDDEKVAAILSYVRREFLDDAPPIEVKSVAEVRRRFSERTEPWTEAELMEAAH